MFGIINWKKTMDLDNAIISRVEELVKQAKKIRDKFDKKDEEGKVTETIIVKYDVDNIQIYDMIEDIKYYFNKFVKKISEENHINENNGVLDLFELDDYKLINEFNFDEFYDYLAVNTGLYDICKLYKNKPEIRSAIQNITMFELIQDFGRELGPERALLFSKITLCSPEIAMQYYNSKSKTKFLKFAKRYFELPNSSSHIHWYPNYFDEDSKARYCTEELSDIVYEDSAKEIVLARK